MTVIKGGNFSNGKTPPEADEYRHCNFAYTIPITDKDGNKVGHQLFPKDSTPRTFHRCNMSNCIPPNNAILTKCITPIIESFDSVNIDGKEAEGYRLYGVTDQVTKKPVYRKNILEHFTVKTETITTFPEKIADAEVPVLPAVKESP